MSYIRSYHVSYQDIPIKAYPGEWIEAVDSHEVISEDNGKPLSINNVLVLGHHNSPSLLDSSSSDSTLIIVRFPNPLASSQLGNLTKFSSVCNSKNPIRLREAPFNLSPPLCGHCPNSNYTPPPHSNGHSGALFFRRDFTIFYHFLPFLPFFL